MHYADPFDHADPDYAAESDYGKVFTNGNVSAEATPFAQAVLAALPANNSVSATGGAPADVRYDTISNNYIAFPRGTIKDDKGDARVDHTFNEKLEHLRPLQRTPTARSSILRRCWAARR